MKIVEKMAAQGDVILLRVDSIPEGAKKDKKAKRIILAHSETGHHHAIDSVGASVWRFERDPMICFLQITEPYADLVHHRPFDTHETLRLTKGIWQARRQREWTPEGWQVVAD